MVYLNGIDLCNKSCAAADRVPKKCVLRLPPPDETGERFAGVNTNFDLRLPSVGQAERDSLHLLTFVDHVQGKTHSFLRVVGGESLSFFRK